MKIFKLVVINIRQNQNLTDFFGCNEKIDVTTEQENSAKSYTVIAIIISVFIFVISLIVVFAISMLYI
jgi:hypothetical protein